jgi:hypothetical protein
MAQPIIGPGVLKTFKGMSEGMMPDTATLHLPGARVDDGGGAWHLEEGSDVSFSCRIMPASDKNDLREFLEAGQLNVTNLLAMYYPLEQDALDAESNLTITSAKFGTARYEVVGAPPLGSFSVHRVAMVRRFNAQPE